MKKLILTSLSIALSTFIYAQPPSYIPTNGLVSWYPFNGNANDESGNGKNGTPINGVTLTSDRNNLANAAYSFDGVDDYIISDSSLSYFSDTLSINFWVDYNSDFGTFDVIDFGDASSVRWGCITGATDLRATVGRGCSGTGNVLTYTTSAGWHMISYIIKDTAQWIYYDGVLVGTEKNSTPSSLSCATTSLWFGVDVFSISEYYNGKLDDIGIWNRALTPAEITQIFNETVTNCNPFSGSLLTGLVASYPFCGNANDESGNNNHCFTPNGALLTPDRFGANNNAYFLDGIDDWIETNTNFYDPNTPHTLSIWWQTTDSTKTNQTLFNTNPHPTENLAFHYSSVTSTPPYDLRFGLGDGIPGSWSIVHPDTGQLTIPTGFSTWHNTVWVRSNSSWTFYQDGTAVLTYTSSLNTIPTNCTLRFGAENNLPSGGAQFKGNIDDIGIWNRALSPSEVLNVFTGGTTAQYQQNLNPITVYPNPTNDFITIELQDHPLSNFEITDQIGRSIEKGILKDKVTLDIRNYGAGCYFLKVSGLKNFKILKIE